MEITTNKEKITFSLEKGFRIFDQNINFFHFFMVQFSISKKEITSGNYTFSLNNHFFSYNTEIIIDLNKDRVVTLNSHEDPLVYDSYNYYICFQIEEPILKKLDGLSTIQLIHNNNSIATTTIKDLAKLAQKYDGTHYSKLNNTHITTNKNCTLTLHLGNTNGEYREETLDFKANTEFNFKDYLKLYEYIGLQCSYEDEIPEIEEKHIVIGQKGIFLSGFLKIDGKKITCPLPFKEEYQKEYDSSDFICINKINELINYYNETNKTPRYFESTINFLLPTYISSDTYNQDGIYSTNKIDKKHQFLLEPCKQCKHNFKCLQAVPSGLSSQLFKKNVAISNPTECEVFRLFE